jgi:hypothetical protein
MQFKISQTDLNIIESIKRKIDNKTFKLSDEFYQGIKLEIDLPDLDAEMFGCWNSNCENDLKISQEDSLHQGFLVNLLNKYNEKNTNSKNQIRFLFGDNMYLDRVAKKTLRENKDLKKVIVHADLTSSIPLVNDVDLREYSAKSLENGFDKCLGSNKPSFITLGNHDVEPLFTMYQQINKCYKGIEIKRNEKLNTIQFNTNWILPNAFYSVKINLPNMSLLFIIMDTNLINYQYHHLILHIDSQTKYIDNMLNFIDKTLIENNDCLKFVMGHTPIFYVGHNKKEPIFQTRYAQHNSRGKEHEHTKPKILNGIIQIYQMMIKYNVRFYMCADEHNLQYLEDKQHKINLLICGASPGGSGADETSTFKSNKDEILFNGDVKIPNEILQHLDKKIIINAPSFMKLVTHYNTIQVNMIGPEKLTQHSQNICSKPNGCIYTDLANATPSLYYSLTVPKHIEYVSVYDCDKFKEKNCK